MRVFPYSARDGRARAAVAIGLSAQCGRCTYRVLRVIEAVVSPKLLVLKSLPEDAQRAEAAAALNRRTAPCIADLSAAARRAIFHAVCRSSRHGVGEKMFDRGDGDHIADVLRILLVLEGYADDAAGVVERRTT